MLTISKDFTFSAGHQLRGLRSDHPCARVHGHNYVVRVELSGSLDDVGFVVDYGDLMPIEDYIYEQFDHQMLNDRVGFNPTAELLALHLQAYTQAAFPGCDVAVGVSETPRTWAWAR